MDFIDINKLLTDIGFTYIPSSEPINLWHNMRISLYMSLYDINKKLAYSVRRFLLPIKTKYFRSDGSFYYQYLENNDIKDKVLMEIIFRKLDHINYKLDIFSDKPRDITDRNIYGSISQLKHELKQYQLLKNKIRNLELKEILKEIENI
jgi:hypothetical protein